MPVQMTFTTLQNDVRAYLERGSTNDPTVYAQLPSLINLAERMISRELKVLGFLVSATVSLQANVAVLAKPDRWRETASINVGNAVAGTIQRRQLYPRSLEYCRTYWPDETQVAPPKFYCDYNYANFLITPTPDQAYPAEVLYYEEPALLDATNQTNWITQYAPNLLLYGTLLQCQPFLKKDDRMQTFQAMYDRAAGVLNSEDTDKVIDRSTIREKP